MAVQVPTSPALSSKLQQIVRELVERNGQYTDPQYLSIQVTLRCDAEGWQVRDWWLSAPAPAGQMASAPPQGVKTAATLTPSTTAAQCDTIAATMIAAVKAVSGPVYVNG